MKQKIDFIKVGILKYYSIYTNREMSAGECWMFDYNLREQSNILLAQFGIHNFFEGLDMRLYVGNKTSSELETVLLRQTKTFEAKVLLLGLIAHVEKNHPDEPRIKQLIKEINNFTDKKLINNQLSKMILNEFCVSEEGSVCLNQVKTAR